MRPDHEREQKWNIPTAVRYPFLLHGHARARIERVPRAEIKYNNQYRLNN